MDRSGRWWATIDRPRVRRVMTPHTTRVLSVLLTTLILSVHIVDGAADSWPQFRGGRAGVAADDPALPDAWSAPSVWGDHVFVTAAVNTKEADEPLKPVPSYTARSFGGPMSGRDIGSSSDAHRWVVWDIDFKTGKVRWQGTVLTGVPVEPKH